MSKDNELNYSHEIGTLKSEVHTLNTLVAKLFEKLDAIIEKMQTKPVGVAGYIGIAVSLMTIMALFFGSMLYITSSAQAPVVAQITQMTQLIADMQKTQMQFSNQGQLLSKELSGIDKSVKSNEGTLQWMIFTENLPKQITQHDGRLNTLEMQMRRVVNQMHIKGK